MEKYFFVTLLIFEFYKILKHYNFIKYILISCKKLSESDILEKLNQKCNLPLLVQ